MKKGERHSGELDCITSPCNWYWVCSAIRQVFTRFRHSIAAEAVAMSLSELPPDAPLIELLAGRQSELRPRNAHDVPDASVDRATLRSAVELRARVVRAVLLRNSQVLENAALQLRRLPVSQPLLAATGLGHLVADEALWAPCREAIRDQIRQLASTWRQLMRKRRPENSRPNTDVLEPCTFFRRGEVVAHAAAVKTMTAWLVALDDVAGVAAVVHEDVAVVLVLQGFSKPTLLNGLTEDEGAALVVTAAAKALVRRAVRVANRGRPEEVPQQEKSTAQQDQPSSSSSTPPPSTSAATEAVRLAATNVQENLKASAEQLGAWSVGARGTQSIRQLALAQASGADVRGELERRAEALRLVPAQHSLRSVGSGLKAWHAFAVDVCMYAPSASLPPRCSGDFQKFLAIFANPGTAANYGGHVKWACRHFGLAMNWYDGQADATMRGARQLYKSSMPSSAAGRPKITTSCLARVLPLAEKSLFNNFGVMLLVCFEALLRAPSECLPLQVGSAKTVQALPLHRHSSVWVSPDGRLHIRLQRRKHRPEGSLLLRPCTCSSTAFCAPHALRPVLSRLPEGARLWDWTSAKALVEFRRLLACASVPDAKFFTWKALRAGKATEMLAQGQPLQAVLAAGEWRSIAVLNYVSAEDIDKAAMLDAVIDESDGE